jgi:hypothetical protein
MQPWKMMSIVQQIAGKLAQARISHQAGKRGALQ